MLGFGYLWLSHLFLGSEPLYIFAVCQQNGNAASSPVPLLGFSMTPCINEPVYPDRTAGNRRIENDIFVGSLYSDSVHPMSSKATKANFGCYCN